MRRLLGVALAMAMAGLGVSPAAIITPAHGVTSDYDSAYRIGLEAYTYGLPLLTMNRTYLTMTSVDVSQGAYGPVNQFNSVSGPNNAGSTAVVAPGATGLSSIAWLDLSREPLVLHVPVVRDHSFVLALIDPYTTNLMNLGTAKRSRPGYYVVRGPLQHDLPIPDGTRAIDVDYTRIWIIGSTQLKGPADVPTVNAIQAGYTLTPLSDFVAGIPARILTPAPGSIPEAITPAPMPTGMAFFDALGALLQQFPPPPADQASLRAFASVGIGPGRTPSQDTHLSADTVRGLVDAAAAGPARIRADAARLAAKGYARHNGYLLGGFGRYGTDYVTRAVVSQVGLGAFTPDQTIYALSWTDDDRAPLDGSRRYVLHLSAPPPTSEGWSLTVYGLNGALIANAANRYAFTSTSSLRRNPDGSVDIYLRSTAPKDAGQRANWLPVAAGQGFEVVWRLMAPIPDRTAGILRGTDWQPPRIEIDTGP